MECNYLSVIALAKLLSECNLNLNDKAIEEQQKLMEIIETTNLEDLPSDLKEILYDKFKISYPNPNEINIDGKFEFNVKVVGRCVDNAWVLHDSINGCEEYDGEVFRLPHKEFKNLWMYLVAVDKNKLRNQSLSRLWKWGNSYLERNWKKGVGCMVPYKVKYTSVSKKFLDKGFELKFSGGIGSVSYSESTLELEHDEYGTKFVSKTIVVTRSGSPAKPVKLTDYLIMVVYNGIILEIALVLDHKLISEASQKAEELTSSQQITQKPQLERPNIWIQDLDKTGFDFSSPLFGDNKDCLLSFTLDNGIVQMVYPRTNISLRRSDEWNREYPINLELFKETLEIFGRQYAIEHLDSLSTDDSLMLEIFETNGKDANGKIKWKGPLYNRHWSNGEQVCPTVYNSGKSKLSFQILNLDQTGKTCQVYPKAGWAVVEGGHMMKTNTNGGLKINISKDDYACCRTTETVIAFAVEGNPKFDVKDLFDSKTLEPKIPDTIKYRLQEKILLALGVAQEILDPLFDIAEDGEDFWISTYLIKYKL